MAELSTFAARLRQLRTEAKLTQHELAERSGVHRQTIAQLETAVRRPAWDTVQALARALGVDCTAFQADDAGPAEATPAKKKRKGK
jgi:transcriptional regulator with XRE-family HTH domain